MRRVVVTGGAGFIGSSISIGLACREPGWEIVAFDNLRRRGSELNVPRLAAHGVHFVHGDVRALEDLAGVGPIDAIVEASAEPSVLAGQSGPDYVVRTNLLGAHNCLEVARRHGSQVVFLSTSRVYPVASLESLGRTESDTRFELIDEQAVPGASSRGISEAFPLPGARSIYGATKLAAELLVVEYADAFGFPAVIDRCGVIAGPWQMGKVDQGVFTFWVAAHYFRRPLAYIGYGGSGKQVRDLLHVDDLVDLVFDQLTRVEAWTGATVNVGGGREGSLSLLEATALCREVTGNAVEVRPEPMPRPSDVAVYLSDSTELPARTTWRPRRDPAAILSDIFDWIRANERVLREVLV